MPADKYTQGEFKTDHRNSTLGEKELQILEEP